MVLKSKDKVSGVENVYMSLNGEPYRIYKVIIRFLQAGVYNLKYYSVDRVGNVEDVKEKLFTIDDKEPILNWAFHGNVSGNTISGNSTIELLALDE